MKHPVSLKENIESLKRSCANSLAVLVCTVEEAGVEYPCNGVISSVENVVQKYILRYWPDAQASDEDGRLLVSGKSLNYGRIQGEIYIITPQNICSALKLLVGDREIKINQVLKLFEAKQSASPFLFLNGKECGQLVSASCVAPMRYMERMSKFAGLLFPDLKRSEKPDLLDTLW